jgi:dinuclear metal center YbgI/SA1388 family protein
MKAVAIIQAVEDLAPLPLALPDDPTGLQCGDTSRNVTRLMLALDACEGTVAQAVKARAHMLLTHHPLVYTPLARLDMTTATGRALMEAAGAGLVVYSVHTNLDASPVGINAILAELAGISGPEPLMETGGVSRMKIAVFVPARSADRVRKAAFVAGAGQIGAYSSCSWASSGEGTFFGGPDSSPAAGTSGRLEQVDELRVEMVADRAQVREVVKAVAKAHPYEEPAIDIYELAPLPVDTGLGLVGRLGKAASPTEVAARLSKKLGTGTARVVSAGSRKVSRVAVCGGSGASLIKSAAACGAALFITGDIKYHDARQAEELGISVIDIGHYPAERYAFMQFGGYLEKKLKERGRAPRFLKAREKDPFSALK